MLKKKGKKIDNIRTIYRSVTVQNWIQDIQGGTFSPWKNSRHAKTTRVTLVLPPLNDGPRENGRLEEAGRLIEVKTIEKPSLGL